MSMTVSHNATVKKLMNTTGFLFGGKNNIQNKTKTQTQTRKKKRKKTILTNSTTQPKC
jgi:hypothetical protein